MTTQQAQHTPGPWHKNRYGQHADWHIRRSDGGDVAQILTNEIDAAFIVRACNSHDDLLAALPDPVRLEMLADWLDRLDTALAEDGLPKEPDDIQRDLRRWAVQARAAIAKATGGQP